MSKTKEERYDDELKVVYMNNLANTVADNIAVRYKYYRNTNLIQLQSIFNTAEDNFILNNEEEKTVHNTVVKILRDKYHLKLVSENHNDYMKLQEIE